MEDNSKLSYFFLGLGLGVAAGVLFAPKSGEETREYLRTKAGEGADYLRSRAEDSADYVRRRSVDLRDSAAEAIDRGKQSLQRQRDNLSAAVDAGRQAYRESMNAPRPE